MYKEKPRALFAKYAIPQMIGLLFNSIYLIVDGIFIGNRLGRDAMAAAAVSVPLIEILIAMAMAVASGAGILISGQLGRKQPGQARRTFTLAVLLLGAMGAAVVVLGNLFIEGLAGLLGATPDIRDAAVSYLWYIVTFSPFLLFSFLLGSLVRNDGRPKLAMFALAFGSVSNMVLDYVFMYPMNMGIGGAALATALGPVFSVLILLPHFLRKKGQLYFAGPRINLGTIRQIFALGFPSFIMEFTIGIVTFVYNYGIVKNGYAEIGLAAYLVIGYLMLIILTMFLGMAEGLQPVFSYFAATGEGRKNRALLAFSARVFTGLGLGCYVVLLLFSRSFLSLFAPGDEELLGFAQGIIPVYFCGFFLAGLNILMISFWQSAKSTKKAMAISLLRSVVVLPVAITVLPLLFGSESIWACHSISEIVTAGCTLGMLLAGKKARAAPPATQKCSATGKR